MVFVAVVDDVVAVADIVVIVDADNVVGSRRAILMGLGRDTYTMFSNGNNGLSYIVHVRTMDNGFFLVKMRHCS